VTDGPAPIWSVATGPHEVAPPGHGEMVLVHGSLDRAAGLLKLSRQFDPEWRVTRYDRRGYGRSRPCDGPFTIAAQVADLVHVVRTHVGASPVVLVSHSYGGNVALATADRHPELVRAIVTYESPMSWEDWWPASSAGSEAVGWGDDPHDAAERFMRRLIGDARWERLPPATRAARRAEGPAMVAELVALRAAPPWDPARIGVPVLAMLGEHGSQHHQRGMRHLADVLPDCTFAVVPGARHFGPNTHAALVAGMIRQFLTARLG